MDSRRFKQSFRSPLKPWFFNWSRLAISYSCGWLCVRIHVDPPNVSGEMMKLRRIFQLRRADSIIFTSMLDGIRWHVARSWLYRILMWPVQLPADRFFYVFLLDLAEVLYSDLPKHPRHCKWLQLQIIPALNAMRSLVEQAKGCMSTISKARPWQCLGNVLLSSMSSLRRSAPIWPALPAAPMWPIFNFFYQLIPGLASHLPPTAHHPAVQHLRPETYQIQCPTGFQEIVYPFPFIRSPSIESQGKGVHCLRSKSSRISIHHHLLRSRSPQHNEPQGEHK